MKDWRGGRGILENIIPSSTGAARATGLVLQAMKGKLDGTALRVPVPDGSVTDFTGVLKTDVTVDEVNAAFKAAAASGALKGILDYSEEPLVSVDYIGNPFSCTLDAKSTNVIDGTMVKLSGWYDNEWGYSSRCVDLLEMVGKSL
jgi:glyceraldehyde 3-phosphate dehydrogenase